jgi:hypothetical protein
MTAVTLPNNGIKSGFLLGESGWDDEMNKNLRLLDALVHARVVDKDLSAPPGSPAPASMYIVGASPTGAWAGQAGKLALWQVGDDIASAWTFIAPSNDWKVYVVDESTSYRYTGTAWVSDAGTFGSYSASFGDAASAVFPIVHGLGSRNVHVTCYRNAAPYDQVVVDVQHTDANTITLTGFTLPPALNQFTVYVSK